MTTRTPQKSLWPPEPTAFQFNNCSAVTQIWSWLLRPSFDPTTRREMITRDILRSLDHFLRTNSLDNPTPDEVLDWFFSDEVFDFFTIQATVSCKRDVCCAAGWDGNPDIAGIGMLATYVIQSTLATIYLVALLVLRSGAFPTAVRTKPLLSRTLSAFQLSTPAFLSATLVFCNALFVSSIFTYGRRDSNAGRITGFLLVLMPLGTVLPALTLHLSASSILRRAKGRTAAWFLVVTLATVLLMIRTFSPEDHRDPSKSILELLCLDLENINTTWRNIVLGLFVTVVPGFAYIICDLYRSGKKHRMEWLPRLIRFCWCAMLILSFLAMWVFVAWLIHLHLKIRNVFGDQNKDAEWSFGQILALATWITPLIDFTYAWWEGPKEALNGQMTDPYVVVEKPEESENHDIELVGEEEVSTRLLNRATV